MISEEEVAECKKKQLKSMKDPRPHQNTLLCQREPSGVIPILAPKDYWAFD